MVHKASTGLIFGHVDTTVPSMMVRALIFGQITTFRWYIGQDGQGQDSYLWSNHYLYPGQGQDSYLWSNHYLYPGQGQDSYLWSNHYLCH